MLFAAAICAVWMAPLGKRQNDDDGVSLERFMYSAFSAFDLTTADLQGLRGSVPIILVVST
ncbi:hypothetical protein LCM4576_33105 [Mesorhizobium sp. LCM 4576]|nr:hypothetical protein LCM4576_33105 [Mesorhizobium sp. LCM 4576]